MITSKKYFLWRQYSTIIQGTANKMSAHSKLLYVCRPDESLARRIFGPPRLIFGPPNQCNIKTGDCHFWLERHGVIIDPSPCTDVLRGENVYIPWKIMLCSEMPKPNGQPFEEGLCWQNVANALSLYPGANIICGTFARKDATGVIRSLYG